MTLIKRLGHRIRVGSWLVFVTVNSGEGIGFSVLGARMAGDGELEPNERVPTSLDMDLAILLSSATQGSCDPSGL